MLMPRLRYLDPHFSADWGASAPLGCESSSFYCAGVQIFRVIQQRQPTVRKASVIMAKRLAIYNLKGGAGKTTTAVMLADGFAHFHKLRVLVMDFDRQASASRIHGYKQ